MKSRLKTSKSSGKSSHGGRRRGAGRKTRKIVSLRAKLSEQVDVAIGAKMPDLLRNLFLLADGITLQRITPDGPLIFTEAPDRAANIYLVDRVLGKPTERHELSSMSDEELIARATGIAGRGGAAGDHAANGSAH